MNSAPTLLYITSTDYGPPLTSAVAVLYGERPAPLGRLAPVVGGHEGPVGEALGRHVAVTALQQRRLGAVRRGEEDLHLSAPTGGQRDDGLNVLQEDDPVTTPPVTAVTVHVHLDLTA